MQGTDKDGEKNEEEEREQHDEERNEWGLKRATLLKLVLSCPPCNGTKAKYCFLG